MKATAKKASAYNGQSTLTILSAVFICILLALAVGVTYALQQRHITDLDNQITSINKQLDAAKTQNQQTPSNTPVASQSSYTSLKSVTVNVFSPQSGATVSSPLAIIGEVPGNWSFEASFPVKLLDSKGAVVAQTSAQVLGDWMTTKLVPFSAKLTWSAAQSGKGTLVLQKDNPSGMAQNDDSVSIPIEF